MARKSRRDTPQPGAAPLPVTVTDVAQRAGVSPITVSRAIHRPERVNQATRVRVLEVVREMGYVPNLLAGSLASSRSRLVAILLPTLTNSPYSAVIQAATDRLTEAGYQALLGPTSYSAEKEGALLEAILGRRPDALVITGRLHNPASRQRLLGAGVPVVEAWDLSAQPLDIQVGFSHEAAGRHIADHFFAKGVRRVAAVSVIDARAARRHGSMAARLGELGAPPVPVEVRPLPASWEVGRAGLAALLARDPQPPELVMCSSDTVALGVIAEAASRGLRVPQDLRVLGFGDSVNGRFAWPALSTVSIHASAMGIEVAEALLRRFHGQPTETHVDTGFTLIERAST
ncbi:substrate-binding domain-containing protein [Pseudomonas sp. NPDC007930]|uniref:LacI family DNA-binding transcriptional regulator n=1 Tax=Pseudomonas sp. NPDC007930 TaxID=3364417 RepID=UPI0036F1064B